MRTRIPSVPLATAKINKNERSYKVCVESIEPKIDPGLLTALHCLSKEIGIPTTRLINMAVGEGLNFFENLKNDTPELLARIVERNQNS